MVFSEILPHLSGFIAAVAALGLAAIAASVHTTRLKVKNGYPLEGMWGQSLKPTADADSIARISLLTQENAQLKAEMGALKDRLATVERIVTDSGFQLTHDIERLRIGENVQ